MKIKKTLVSLALLLGLFVAAHGQAIALLDFETAGGYITSIPEYTDTGNDYFTRSDSSTNAIASYEDTASGSYWFAAQDIDSEGAALPVDFSWSVNISGFTGLSFDFDVAEDDDSTRQDWDSADYVRAYYSIDGGTEQNLIWFQNDGTTNNTAPLLDSDFDGLGDGVEVTDTFTNFSNTIVGIGEELTIRVEFSLNSGDEDFAMDNLRVTGTAVPEPSSFALLAGCLALTSVITRRRPSM